MKKFAVIFLLLNFFAICSLSAEEKKYDYKKLEFSALFGIGSNQLLAAEYVGGTTGDSKKKLNFFLGVGSEYRVSRFFSVAPQIYFITKNFAYEDEGTYKNYFLELPLLIKFSYNLSNQGRIYFGLGPQISFLINNSLDATNSSISSADKEAIEKKTKPSFSTYGVVLCLGGVYKNYFIEGRADGADAFDVPNSTMTNKYDYFSLLLTLGYIF